MKFSLVIYVIFVAFALEKVHGETTTPNSLNNATGFVESIKSRDAVKGSSSSPEPSTHGQSPRAAGGSSTHGGQTVNREAEVTTPNLSSPSGSSDPVKTRDKAQGSSSSLEPSTHGQSPRAAGAGSSTHGGQTVNREAEATTPNLSSPSGSSDPVKTRDNPKDSSASSQHSSASTEAHERKGGHGHG
ncbi:uncharacterized protein LOC141858467 [Brevipalpus obovatus]|uniref:uncharacterized protein LOC141858467 n=1 Tax=Brevipalpus obovatus TaxID=246614 RepID=UPI003D9F4AFA